jgi:hypothetical protein
MRPPACRLKARCGGALQDEEEKKPDAATCLQVKGSLGGLSLSRARRRMPYEAASAWPIGACPAWPFARCPKAR